MDAAITPAWTRLPLGEPPAPARPWRAAAGWGPTPPRRRAAVGVLALHVLALALLAQAGRHAVVPPAPAPLTVTLLGPQSPQAPLARPTATPPPLLTAPAPTWVPAVPVPDAGAPAAPVAREPAASPVEATPVAQPVPTATTPATSPVAPPPPGPKLVAAGSLRYRVEPAVEVPRLSRRAGEHGRVVLRVVFDTEGRPRDIQLQRSSGFARLDAQAREAMAVARIAPYLEDGRAIEVVASATLEYELD